MIFDPQKLHQLINRPFRRPRPDELRREENVFFIGCDLPAQETLETVFESHSLSPVELMYISFGGIDTFHRGEELARLIKKNFHIHLMGRFDWPAPPHVLERAYAAGIDFVDLPLTIFDSALSRERGLRKEETIAALERAKEIFPGCVVSTLTVGEEACCSTVSAIDALLKRDILPIVEVSPRAGEYLREEIQGVFSHLAESLKRRKQTARPFLPLMALVSPLSPAKRKGILSGFMDKLSDTKRLAASDLRRSLRVRQIEESYESSGL